MTEHEASRTLVKSPPELWAECSEASSLARHLDGFGEIRITRLEPESAVAWEGERARGMVRLEPSGWGTKVILSAVSDDPAPEPPEPPEAVAPSAPPEAIAPPRPPEPLVRPEPPGAIAPPPAPTRPGEATASPPRRTGFLGRLRSILAPPRPPMAQIELQPIEPPPPPPAPEPAAVAAPSHLEPAKPPVPAPQPDPPLDEYLRAALDSLGQAHHRPYSRS